MAAYLKYNAIKKGESLAQGHEGDKGWVEIGSVQLGAGRNISTPVGVSSKREASAPTVSEITITKLMDSTSPLIFQELLIGKASNAQIDLVETGTDQLETFLTLSLENCLISNYKVHSQGDRPAESFSLNFTRIEYKYTPYDNQHKPGTSVQVRYDLAGATAGR